MADGLLRLVAEISFGGQTDAEVRDAAGWLQRRRNFSSGYLLEVLSESVHPRIAIEKSPSLVSDPKSLLRVRALFPHARFIHLVQHPCRYGQGLMRAVNAAAALGRVPEWLRHLASFRHSFAGESSPTTAGPDDVDPQRAWYALHWNVSSFLDSVPQALKLRLRAEDVLSDPGRLLPEVCRWLKVRDDEESLNRMMHPEHSPFAQFGPSMARFGNDPAFLENPMLQSLDKKDAASNLDERPPWRRDGVGFAREVKELAREFGYE
jgi:hypothetical protein